MSDSYYVIHIGRGTDGGFGDYSPPYWSPEPIAIDGRTVWLTDEEDAHRTVKALNRASSDVFPWESYSGEFPIEYQYRKITPPQGESCSAEEAIELVTSAHSGFWPEPDYYEDDDDEA